MAVGFLAAVFGGTKTVISGPTGPMAVAMAVIIANHAGNDIGHALTIVVLAGVVQILLSKGTESGSKVPRLLNVKWCTEALVFTQTHRTPSMKEME